MSERRIEKFDTTNFIDEGELSPKRAAEIVEKLEKHECPFRFKDKVLYMRYCVLRAITACRINGRPFIPASIPQHNNYWEQKIPLARLDFDNSTIPSVPVSLSVGRSNEIISAFEIIDPDDSKNTIKTLPFRAGDTDIAILDLLRQAYIARLQSEGKAPFLTDDEEAELYEKWNKLCGNMSGSKDLIKNPVSPLAIMQISPGIELMAVSNDSPDSLRNANVQLCFASTTPPLVIRGNEILRHLFFQMETHKTILKFHAVLRNRIKEYIDRMSSTSSLQSLERDPSGDEDRASICLTEFVIDGEDTWRISYRLLDDDSVVKQYLHQSTGDVFCVVLKPDGTLELPKLREGEEIVVMGSNSEEGEDDDGVNFCGGADADCDTDEHSLDSAPPNPDKDVIN